jgi:hypothetical protein
MADLVGEVARPVMIPIGLYHKHIQGAFCQPINGILGLLARVSHLRIPLRVTRVGAAIVEFVARDFSRGVWRIPC